MGARFLKTKYLAMELCFVPHNPYSFVQGVYSNGILLSDELTGDVFALKLHREPEGFLMDHFSQSHIMTRIVTHITYLHYGFSDFLQWLMVYNIKNHSIVSVPDASDLFGRH